MSNRAVFLLILSCSVCLATDGQVHFRKKGMMIVPELGYSKQGSLKRMDANFILIFEQHRLKKTGSGHNMVVYRGFGGVAGLFGLVNKQNTFRVGQQLALHAFCIKKQEDKVSLGFKAMAGLENYTKKDQRISLAGGPVFGFLHAQYGYSIPVGREAIAGVGRHRLGIFIYFGGKDNFVPGHR